MITSKDIYDVFEAIVPLYAAMILAYGSVRWWKIFTPDQCSGINRFVALFAVPLLSFHFISSNDPYAINYKFILADSLQKVVILVALFLWQAFSKRGNLEWMITLFSLSTLPNTLVMGIPLLKAMYGDFSRTLMVQIVVLQFVIWYTLILFMFEYRDAKLLISEQFPETAASITSFRVDSDVVSLSGREPLQTDAEIGDNGKLHVVVKRSNESSFNRSHSLNSLKSMTSRASNLTGVEFYSVQSSLETTSRASSFNQTDFYAMFSASKAPSHEHGYTNSFQGGFGDDEEALKMSATNKKRRERSDSGGGGGGEAVRNKDLHMFVWNSSASLDSQGNLRHAVNQAVSTDFGVIDPSNAAALQQHETAASKGMHDLILNMSPGRKMSEDRELDEIEEGSKFPASASPYCSFQKKVDTEDGGVAKKHQMLPASVMIRLIFIMIWRKLIRNPNTYASLLGLAWSLISYKWHIKMPTIVSGSVSILSDAGLGMAMFSLGLFMALQPKIIACGKSVATFAMAVRFLAGPAVIAGTSIAVGLRGVLLHVAIVQAALPQGIIPFVFAKEYNVHADILSTVIIFGMLLAVAVTIIYYVLLGL
ncbi:unnamed protein product [Prunus brigantina]